MASQNVVMTGNVAGVPELAFTGDGTPRCVVTVVCQERYRDASGSFKDGSPYFCRCTAWGNLAEHIGQTVSKGDRVIATGEFVSRSWDKEDGTKGYATDLRLSDLGVSLLWAEARVTRVKGTRRPASDSVAPSWTPSAADSDWDAAAAGSTSTAEGVAVPF